MKNSHKGNNECTKINRCLVCVRELSHWDGFFSLGMKKAENLPTFDFIENMIQCSICQVVEVKKQSTFSK